jgi:hypothetical protein
LIIHMTQGWMKFRRRLTSLPVIRGQLLRIQTRRGLALGSRDEQPSALDPAAADASRYKSAPWLSPTEGRIIDES